MELPECCRGEQQNNTVFRGDAQWAQPIIGLMLDGMGGVADYECAQILDSRYHRLDCIFDQVIPLDCYQKVGDLIRYADGVDIAEAVEWIEGHIA